LVSKAFVDTEIWVLAKKKPVREKFRSQSDYERALKIHEGCRRFFEKDFENLRIYMTLHQVAEIFHVLAFRGYKIPLNEAFAIVDSLMKDDSIIKVPILAEHVIESLIASKETDIHIWDFLCFVPLKNYVEIIYSLDRHFLEIGKRYGIKVVNPAQEWLEI